MSEEIIFIAPTKGGFIYTERNVLEPFSIFVKELATSNTGVRRFECSACHETDCHHVYCVLSEIADHA
jgi:hypothetical protein